MSIKDRDTMFLVKLALFAIVTRFLFALSYHIVFIMSSKELLYAPDGEAYSTIAWYIALVLKGVNCVALPARYLPLDCWINDRLFVYIAEFAGKLPPPSGYQVGFYSYMMGIFYYIFGYVPVLFRFLNIVMSIGTAVLCYKLAKDVFNKTVARTSFVLMLLLPSQFIYSTSLLRDMFINFFVMSFIYCALMIKRADKLSAKIRMLNYMCISGLLLYLLRDSAAFVAIVSLLLYAVVIFARRNGSFFSVLGMFVLGALLLGRLPITDYLYKKTIELMNRHVAFVNCGGLTYRLLPDKYYGIGRGDCMGVTGLQAREIVFAGLRGFKTFIVEPGPFFHSKYSYLLFLPEMIIWYFIVIFSMIGIMGTSRKADVRIVGLWLFLLLFSVMIVMPGGNVEALIRHRGMIIPVYAILAGYGYSIIGRKCHGRRDVA